jgi:hypothetical protein
MYNITRLIYYYITANFGYFMLKLAVWLKLHHPFLQISYSVFYWRLHTNNQLPRLTGSALTASAIGLKLHEVTLTFCSGFF